MSEIDFEHVLDRIEFNRAEQVPTIPGKTIDSWVARYAAPGEFDLDVLARSQSRRSAARITKAEAKQFARRKKQWQNFRLDVLKSFKPDDFMLAYLQSICHIHSGFGANPIPTEQDLIATGSIGAALGIIGLLRVSGYEVPSLSQSTFNFFDRFLSDEGNLPLIERGLGITMDKLEFRNLELSEYIDTCLAPYHGRLKKEGEKYALATVLAVFLAIDVELSGGLDQL